MRERIVLVLALCAGLGASAQGPSSAPAARSISLRECIELALTHNLDLQIERGVAEVKSDELVGGYGPFVPVFSFRARHEYDSQPGDFVPSKFNIDFPYIKTVDSLGSDLSGMLPIGLSYDFTAESRHDDARTDFSAQPNDAKNFPGGLRQTNSYFGEARVTLRQHLLKDFWIDTPREQILIRRKELKMSQQALRFQIMKTLLAVELAYDDLIVAREEVEVQEKALELRRQLVKETERRVQVGDLPPLDSEQAQTQLQNTITSVTAARELFVARQNLLKSLLTDDFRQWGEVELRPTDALLVIPPAVNRSESSFAALQNRPDLIEARLAVERTDVEVRFRFNQLFPSLDVIGRYGGQGANADSSTAGSDVLNFRDPEYFYGAVVSFPLSNVAQRGNYRASKGLRQVAQLQLKKAENEVLLEVADLVNRVESRFSQVGSTRQARSYAEAALAAEQKKLENGFSTSFFVLQLQETLTAARTAELQALADYNKALAHLAFAEGRTLERNGLNPEVR